MNTTKRRRLTEQERFWKKVDLNGPIPERCPELGPCHVWTAATDKDGYGLFHVDDHTLRRAHRVAWRYEFGDVPGQLDHRCHNEPCVNLRHLRPATNKLNSENLLLAVNNKSGVRGVWWCKPSQKWKAQVGHNGRLHHVGYFTSLDDATAAVIAKRIELHTYNDDDRRARWHERGIEAAGLDTEGPAVGLEGEV